MMMSLIDVLDMIVYFDAITNEFNKIPMPKPKHAYQKAISGLGVLDGMVALTFWDI